MQYSSFNFAPLYISERNFFSVATYLPYVCASVAMGLIFSMLFDEQAGLINAILET